MNFRSLIEAIFQEACRIQAEDQEICDELGRIGAELVQDQDVLITHCNAYIDSEPVWRIPSTTFESTLALSLRDQDAFDRGLGAG